MLRTRRAVPNQESRLSSKYITYVAPAHGYLNSYLLCDLGFSLVRQISKLKIHPSPFTNSALEPKARQPERTQCYVMYTIYTLY